MDLFKFLDKYVKKSRVSKYSVFAFSKSSNVYNVKKKSDLTSQVIVFPLQGTRFFGRQDCSRRTSPDMRMRQVTGQILECSICYPSKCHL